MFGKTLRTVSNGTVIDRTSARNRAELNIYRSSFMWSSADITVIGWCDCNSL